MLTLPRLTLVAVLPICLSSVPGARAQDASDWDAQAHTAVRLIAGAMTKSSDAAFVRAGIEIKLDSGWKTYWRDPGDSGVPPKLDFSGSDNVKTVTVLWPAPQRFPDGAGGNSIGYSDHVVLPLRIAPQDAAKQLSLQLKLGLSGDGAEEATIEKAEVHVPRRVALGPGHGDDGKSLAILAVHREPG